jgi:hypothetical protein
MTVGLLDRNQVFARPAGGVGKPVVFGLLERAQPPQHDLPGIEHRR